MGAIDSSQPNARFARLITTNH